MSIARQAARAENLRGNQEHFDVAVVGGGQAGLAIGYFLSRQGRSFVILEAADSIGAAWRTRWDSLVLFTPRRYSALAGMGVPGDPDGYPTRDEVLAYLEEYAETFKLPVRLNAPVRRLSSRDGGFVLELDEEHIVADQVVVATGPFQVPLIPAVAGELSLEVFQVHSTGYMQPSDIPPGTVVVVGGGNTGYQIAKELSATHRVYLAVGSRQTPLPQRFLGRDLFWWLTKTGLIKKTVETLIGQRMQHRDTLIGSSPRDVRRHGVALKPRVTGASSRSASFADGSELEVDAVIWATGYRSDYSWTDASIVDSSGRVTHRRGVTDVPGLYFLGLSWQHTRGSALIGWVKDDAEFIAEQIAAAQRERRGRETHHATGTLPRAEEADVKPEAFSRETTGLAEVTGPEVVELQDGDEFDLRIEPVAKTIGGDTVRMLAYNRSVPGPTLRVRQDSKLIIHVTNEGDLEATVHWHGLRLENRYDGTHETQAPIPVGETFTYEVSFPDPGAYWYHPHIREDYGQELGLYGNILVVPSDSEYWPPAHREVALTLDDILIEDGMVAAFGPDETTHVAMGRFGNVMLVSGEPDLELEAARGEVVRFYLTNTANTRVFNVALPGARMKLVGADSGHYEREEFVEQLLIAPSERLIVDVHFAEPGAFALEHQTPQRTYRLAGITVRDEGAEPSLGDHFEHVRTNPDMVDERRRTERYLDAEPHKTLAFVAEMDLGTPEGPVVYACPMHPEVVSEEPARCPKCGMTLLATAAPPDTTYACPMHPEVTSDAPDHCPKCGMKLIPAHLVGESGHEEHRHHEHAMDDRETHHDHSHEHAHDTAQGIEWEDDMVEVNRMTTPANMRWKLVDRSTGAENAAIAWRFRVGDQVKIRLVNEMDSDHPMPHPFHIHGAGRFLVLARDGVPEPNLVWKDTVLVRTGETVDILLDVSNPGRWMAHCHIAEHHESGMMFSFDVEP